MSKNISMLLDGYYLISSQKDPQKCLVYLYSHPDFKGVRHIAFGPQDGAALLPETDLTDDSILEPVTISHSRSPMTTAELNLL